MACSFGGVGAIPPRDSVTSIRVGLAPARMRYLSRRFQSPWKIANVVVGLTRGQYNGLPFAFLQVQKGT